MGVNYPLLQQTLVTHVIKFPDSVLAAADRITLKDLLASPAFQCFLVSSVSNGIQSFPKFADVTDESDEFLMFRLNQIFKGIYWEDRKHCFDEVIRLYRERREERMARV